MDPPETAIFIRFLGGAQANREADNAELLDQLPLLRAEKAKLEAEIAAVGEKPNIIELHPTAGRAYLEAVDHLEATLATPSEGREHPAVGPIRQLIDRVVVTPSNETLAIRVEGKLDALIGGGQYPAMELGGLLVAEDRYRRSPQGAPSVLI